MSTRVSWIDETHLQALLQRLETPVAVEPEVETPDLETLPDAEDEPLAFFDEVEEVKPAPVPVAEEFPKLPVSPERVMETVQPAEEVHEEPAPAVEVEAAPPLDRIRERLRMIRHRAAAAGILSHTLPAEEPNPAALESPEARLASFAKQVLAILPKGARLIILDADGAIIWNNDPKPGLVLSTLMALKAAQHGSLEAIQQSEATHHDLPPDQVLSVFTHATSAGPLKIAIKAREAIGAGLIAPYRSLL